MLKTKKESLKQLELFRAGKTKDLSYCNLFNANLVGANLKGADLNNANLENTILMNVNLRYANLTNANLTNAYLWNANLEYANLKNAILENADLKNADLEDANLEDAYLKNACLKSASLWNCIGNMKEIKNILINTYYITYTKERLQIGCENYSFPEWKNFSDKRILKMDGRKALDFWKKYKDYIFTTIELSPAT